MTLLTREWLKRGKTKPWIDFQGSLKIVGTFGVRRGGKVRRNTRENSWQVNRLRWIGVRGFKNERRAHTCLSPARWGSFGWWGGRGWMDGWRREKHIFTGMKSQIISRRAHHKGSIPRVYWGLPPRCPYERAGSETRPKPTAAIAAGFTHSRRLRILLHFSIPFLPYASSVLDEYVGGRITFIS